jgi:hypothetical protein
VDVASRACRRCRCKNGEKLWELVAGEDGEAVVKKLHYAIEDAQKEK